MDLYNFPCHYLFKVFGPKDNAFKLDIYKLLKAYDTSLDESNISIKDSKNKVYSCYSFSVYIYSKEQVIEIYGKLKKHPQVRYLL